MLIDSINWFSGILEKLLKKSPNMAATLPNPYSLLYTQWKAVKSICCDHNITPPMKSLNDSVCITACRKRQRAIPGESIGIYSNFFFFFSFLHKLQRMIYHQTLQQFNMKLLEWTIILEITNQKNIHIGSDELAFIELWSGIFLLRWKH